MIPFDKLEPYSKIGDITPEMFVRLFTAIRTVARREDYTYLYRRFFKLYQMSPYWKKKRREIIKRQNGICFDCNDKIKEIHHKSYRNVGNEPWEDLMGLCRDCHEKRYKKHKLAQNKPVQVDDILRALM